MHEQFPEISDHVTLSYPHPLIIQVNQIYIVTVHKLKDILIVKRVQNFNILPSKLGRILSTSCIIIFPLINRIVDEALLYQF